MKSKNNKSAVKKDLSKKAKVKKLSKAEAKKLAGGLCWSDSAGTVCSK